MGFFSKLFKSKSSRYGESLSDIVKEEVERYDKKDIEKELTKLERGGGKHDPVLYMESVLLLFTLIGFYFTNSRRDINSSEARKIFLNKTPPQVVERGSVGWGAMLSSDEPKRVASKQAAERYFDSEPSQEQIEHFMEHARSFVEVVKSFDRSFG
jgi:hypothetical protein